MTEIQPATDEQIENNDVSYASLIARIRAETAKNSGEAVAWQCLDKHGQWITMPGDWTPEENIKGYEYRPLYAAPASSRTEQAEVVGWVSQREHEHLRKGNVASIGPKSYERVIPVYATPANIRAEAIGIKPLDWEHTCIGISRGHSVLGAYRVNTDGLWWFGADGPMSQALSMEEAQAAAQADYEQRIRSALLQQEGE